MAKNQEKPRTYRTNGAVAKQARERTGLTQAGAAIRWEIGERTIGAIESSEGASAAKIKIFAEQCGINNWHDLLANEEKARLAVSSSESTPGTTASVSACPSGASRLFQLPSVVGDFTGREREFRQMVDRLSGKGGALGISALKGMGGVGKTTLAVKVAHEVRDHFPEAQLFLDLRGMSAQPMTVSEAMGNVIHDFHPDENLPEKESDLLNRYRSVLSGKRVIVLLDNAKDEVQVKHLVNVPPPVGFIVTSRNALGLDAVESIRLDVLSPNESLILLRGIVGEKGLDDELRSLAELCGWLPLALRVAGDLLRLKEGWTLPWFITVVNEERLKWLKIHGDPQKDVEAVLKLSAAQLVRDNPVLATRWHLLSDWPSDFAADAAAVVWNLESEDYSVINDLSELTNRSLIHFEQDSGRYRFHDLMKPIARGLFG